MLKRPHWTGLILAVLMALVFLNLPEAANARIKRAIGGFFLPLFGLAGAAQSLGDAAGLRAMSKSALAAEVERLRRENSEWQARLAEFEEIARENAVLRDAVAWQKRMPWKMRLARVIARDPANWWRTIEIDLGSSAGVAKNLPVITAQGLVGRVQEVMGSSSRVVLLGDPQCPVPAVVDNPTRDTGIILPGEGTVLDSSVVEMTYLPRGSQAIPGQKVFTSGLGGNFPKGIPIGHISATNSVEFGLYLEAKVKLSAQLGEIEEVFVLYP